MKIELFNIHRLLHKFHKTFTFHNSHSEQLFEQPRQEKYDPSHKLLQSPPKHPAKKKYFLFRKQT